MLNILLDVSDLQEASTFSDEDRREKLKKIQFAMGLLNEEARLLISTCHHHVAEIPGDYYATDEWRSDGANCAGCGLNLGWYCPASPDHFCHYEGKDGVGDYDSCDYCGMPDERK